MYYFIVNPRSSSGRGLALWQRLSAELQREQTDYKVFFTEHPGHATELAHRLSADARSAPESSGAPSPCTIVAVGGDGTANEVIGGLTNFRHIRFGYIPTGSGNDLARGLSLPSDPLKALAAILKPASVRDVNIGRILSGGAEHRFLVSSGAGFDAAVCHEAAHSRIKLLLNRFRLGKLSYLMIALRNLLSLKPCGISLCLDEARTVHYDAIVFAAIMNLRFEGGGFMFCPDADPSDDLLDLCIVESMAKPKLLALLPTAFFGKHVKYRVVHIHRCRRLVLRADRPLALHTDGEPHTFTDSIAAELCTEKLPVIVR